MERVQQDTNASWTTDAVAFAVRITGISRETGEASFELEPAWWDAATLMRDDRFLQSEHTRGYQDYDADLSVDETCTLHKQSSPTQRQAFSAIAAGLRSFSRRLQR